MADQELELLFVFLPTLSSLLYLDTRKDLSWVLCPMSEGKCTDYNVNLLWLHFSDKDGWEGDLSSISHLKSVY